MTLDPVRKYRGTLQVITGGKAAKMERVRGGAGRQLRGTNYGDYPRPRGGGDRYGNPDGERYPNPALARAIQPSRGISLVMEIRSNKGLHRTAHKLPRPRGLAMINPVEAAHYCARALFGEP